MASILARISYYYDTNKRKKLLEDLFGKQSKLKNRNEYTAEFCRFLHVVYPEYAKLSVDEFNQFIKDILAFLEVELQSISTSAL
jgi:hypothetical protein